MRGEAPDTDARFRSVHEIRLTHRLEAFSDIVLGFALGQMSLNFVLPQHAIEVYTDPTALFAFVFTFLIVSITWYAHHRLFAYYFVPNAASIGLNFVVLALVVWLVYQLEVYVHFAHSADRVFAATSYTLTFAVVWMLLGVLYALNLRAAWPHIDEAARRGGITSIGRLGATAIGTALSVAALRALQWPVEFAFWAIAPWAVFGRLCAAFYLRRMA